MTREDGVIKHGLQEGPCKCGCGRAGIPNRADDAVLLAKGRETVQHLENLAKLGGGIGNKAEHLLWAWSRAEMPLDDHVHGRDQVFLGPPTPSWFAHWRERALAL